MKNKARSIRSMGFGASVGLIIELLHCGILRKVLSSCVKREEPKDDEWHREHHAIIGAVTPISEVSVELTLDGQAVA